MIQPKIEYQNINEINEFQNKALIEMIGNVLKNSPYYQQLFEKNNIKPNEIQTIEDLKKIPPTTKKDLQLYNQDFIATDLSNIIDYSTTSGTLGQPIVMALTDKDIDRLAYNEAISFACAGITKQDKVQLMTTMDKQFMAGLAYFLGLKKIGASVIRIGAGLPEMQWNAILKHKPNVIIAVPSFILKLIEYAQKFGINLNETSVKKAICIGEPLRDENLKSNVLAKKINENWNIQLLSTYASTEMSTAFTECEFQKGGHHHPELIITELLDDENNIVKENEYGELTITTLGVEGMPLIRYKTGDIVRFYHEKCKCGKTTKRISSVLGRKQQMIKYKGTTIFPPAIQNVINELNNIKLYQIIISKNELNLDEILIKVAINENHKNLIDELKNNFKSKIKVTPKIEIVNFENLQPLVFNIYERKPKYIIDLR
jgi:phenylacetate-CoA ligase